MAQMTATEARIRATIEREENVEAQMEDIMSKIETACDKGLVSLQVDKSEISLKAIQQLVDLGYTVISNKDTKEKYCVIKW